MYFINNTIYTFLYIFRMLHNVVMKATFERVGGGSEDEAKLKGADKSPFYIGDNSDFIPADDIVCSLERNGHNIIVERTLSATEFHSLFRNVSEFFPKQPKDPYVVGNPCSLLTTSSRVATQSLTARFVVKQPREFAEKMACNLPPTELADFVMKEKTVEDMRKDFTVDGFQSFLLYFFKTYSRSADLPNYVRSELKLAKKTIKSAVYNMAACRTRNSTNWRFFHIDWVFPALGCFNQLYQFSFRNESEYIFYVLKFRHQRQYGRYPVPKVPFCLSRLVPERDYMINDLRVLDDETTRNTRSYIPKDTKHEEFLMVMSAIAEGAWRECHHEVLAFSTFALCNEDMLYNPYWRKYYFYVWGEMAVSLAELNLPETFAYSCLEKMKDYEMKSISFELDALLYNQKVASAFGKYELQEMSFNKMMELVPKHSCFFYNSLMVHMQSFKKYVEDLLAKAFAYRKDGEDDFNTFFGMDVRKSALVRFEDSIEDLLDKHKKLMHKLCATISREKKRVVFEQQLMLIRLYEELLMSIKYSYGSQNNWHLVEASLVTSDCHERHFVSYYKGPVEEQHYLDKLNEIKQKVEKQTKVVNHQAWAHVCFTHLLMLKAVNMERPNVEEFLYEEALRIYKIHDHPRALTIKAHLIEHTQHNSFIFRDSAKIEKNCTLQWLIRNGPKVKQFIRLGISSAERFDLWLTTFDWDITTV